MKKLLLLAVILTGCTQVSEVPETTLRINYADTTENGIIRLDLDYPAAMFGGNGNNIVKREINRIVFSDTLNAPLYQLINHFTETHADYNLNLSGRFTGGTGTYVSYILTDSTTTIRSVVFSTIDGHRISLEEACDGDFTEILAEQLNAHKPDCPADYTMDPIPLSDNWTVDGFGITFHYNAGEIAPTIVSITVPWSDFR